MNEQLTVRELALYYGASATVKHTSPDTFPYFEDGKMYPISGGMLKEHENGGIVVLPILRPLSDMTEDEAKEFVPLCAGSQIASFQECESQYKKGKRWQIEFENGDVGFLMTNDDGETWFVSYFQYDDVRQNWPNTINQHKQTAWLLSRRFDLFGWIEKGLAIDATKKGALP